MGSNQCQPSRAQGGCGVHTDVSLADFGEGGAYWALTSLTANQVQTGFWCLYTAAASSQFCHPSMAFIYRGCASILVGSFLALFATRSYSFLLFPYTCVSSGSSSHLVAFCKQPVVSPPSGSPSSHQQVLSYCYLTLPGPLKACTPPVCTSNSSAIASPQRRSGSRCMSRHIVGPMTQPLNPMPPPIEPPARDKGRSYSLLDCNARSAKQDRCMSHGRT